LSDTEHEEHTLLQLAIHAAIAIVGLLTPNRATEIARHLVRQIVLVRIQWRWITMSGTDFFDNSHCPATEYECQPYAGR
jgi:hypothetical protein